MIEPPSSFELPRAMFDEIVLHLRGALPEEGCGLLAVSKGLAGRLVATQFFPGTNVDQSPSRFTMAPEEVIGAMRTIRQSGWELGAIVHSHPGSTAVPSDTDLAEAYYPDALMLIVSFQDETPEMRGWAIAGETGNRVFQEHTILIVEPVGPVPSGKSFLYASRIIDTGQSRDTES